MNAKINTVNFSDVLNPSCTYFRTSDVRPETDGETITIVSGRGQSRSWGSPNVSSTVKELAPDVVAVEVTGWHKHSVSPEGGTYYFVEDANGKVKRTTANNKIVKAVLNG